MARVGEGDQRWIVEDRRDGTNVHNWHWSEKDILDWARKRLTQLLGSIKLSEGPHVHIQTVQVQTVTGEAFINNRKNKLIPSYELEVQGSWSGEYHEISAESVPTEGHFHFPYIADENADEDPELRFTTASESAAAKAAKQALLSQKEAFLAPVRTFIREVQAGGPVNKDADAAASQSTAAASAPAEIKQQAQAAKATSQVKPELTSRPGEPAGTRSLQLKEQYYARARDLYECFTDARRVQAFTQSPAKIEPRPGGHFEIFGGAVVGSFTHLDEPKQIKLDWQFRNWEDSSVSKVVLSFEEPSEGTTVVKLKHTGIPEADRFGNGDVLDNTRNGWQQQIFHKIRAVFGYGL